MAQDGCQEPEWYGTGMFGGMGSHLPGQGQRPSENYGQARHGGGHGGMGQAPAHGAYSGTQMYGASQGHMPSHGYSAHAKAKHGGGGGGGGYAQPPSGPYGAPRAKTGTWDGPAPRGYLRPGPDGTLASPAPAAAPKLPEKRDMALLGGSGVRVPMVNMRIADDTPADDVKAGLAAGYRGIDCEPSRAAEEAAGAAIKGHAGGRGELFVTAKLPCAAHNDVAGACDATLAALGVDCVDLYLIAWPVAHTTGGEVDGAATLEGTWKAMEGLVAAGKAKAIGMANFSVAQVDAVLKGCTVKPAVNQVELHPFLPQRKLVGVCRRYGVAVQAHSPLGHGRLPEMVDHAAVAEAAAAAGKTPAQILLRYSIHRGVPVVVKASGSKHAEHLEVFDWDFRPTDKRALDAMECGRRAIEPPAGMTWDDPELGGLVKPSVTLLGLPR